MRNKAINILAIDDNFDNLITLKALTSEAFPNAKMKMALSGREGLELVIAEKPDVILLDIVMPDMDGFEVCQKIRSNPLLADIPVIFITALKGDRESRIRSLEVGGDAFLAKPVDQSELVAQISAMVKINLANKEKKNENQRLEMLVAEKTEELKQTHFATLNLLEDLRAEIETRKETEIALRESEEKFRNTADFLPQVIFEISLEGIITYVNKQAENLFGYKTQDLIGKHNNMIHIPEEYDRVRESIVRKLKGEVIQNKEFTMIHKDGSRIPGYISINPIVKDDKIIGVRGVIIDMTEQKQAENALRESEEKFKDTANLLPQVIFEIAMDGTITYVNKQAENLFGYKTEELIGQNNSFIHIPEEIDRVKESIIKKFRGEYIPNKEFTFVRKDKSRFTGLIYISPIVKDEVIIGVRGVIIDMTEQKQAEKALRESEALYKAIIEASPDNIIITDTTGNIEIISSSSLQNFQIDKDDQVIGKNIAVFIDKKDINKMQGDFAKMLKGIKTGPNEYKSIRSDQSSIDIEVNGGLIKDADGIVSKLVFVARDITEKKLAREALIESENRYEAFINNNVNLIFVKDEQCRYLVVNDAMAKFFEKSKEEILFKTDEQLASKDVMYPCISSDIKALSAKEPFLIEETLGEKIYETIKFPMQLANNKKGIGGIMRDITARKTSEKALESSQEELQAIYDNAPVMMALIDDKRQILFANKAFTAMTDMSDDRVEDRIGGIIGCINSSNNEAGCGYGNRCKECSLRASIAQTFKTGKGFKNIDYSFLYKSEKGLSERNLIASTAIIQHKDQKNVLLCFHDITDRKKAEDALQKSESLLRSFIDNSPFEIWARDIEKVGILENKKYLDNHGSIIGNLLETNKRTPTDKLNKLNRINKTVFKGETVDNEIEFKVRGEYRIFQQIIFPIKNLTKIIGVAGFNIDITDRKKSEKALKGSQEQLKKFAAHLQNIREEERILLAREIHDDLGQILVAMKIDMGIMKQSIKKSTVDIDPSKLLVEFENLLQLVDTTIKTTRRIMTNLRPEVLDMLGFIEAIKQYLKAYEERHKVKCTLINNSIDIDLNPQKAVALYRIIQEALNNIAKHAKASLVNVNIVQDSNRLTLEVIDDGVGFDSTAKMRSDSYGLIGMKERIFLLDGELNITSKLGQGTTVKVAINL